MTITNFHLFLFPTKLSISISISITINEQLNEKLDKFLEDKKLSKSEYIEYLIKKDKIK